MLTKLERLLTCRDSSKVIYLVQCPLFTKNNALLAKNIRYPSNSLKTLTTISSSTTSGASSSSIGLKPPPLHRHIVFLNKSIQWTCVQLPDILSTCPLYGYFAWLYPHTIYYGPYNTSNGTRTVASNQALSWFSHGQNSGQIYAML